jgi:hypothetical protein
MVERWLIALASLNLALLVAEALYNVARSLFGW